jgi:serine/threonine protein phosphatase PrpC
VTVLRSGSATDVGRVRKVNQDLPLEAADLFAVADGMGGHVGGEVAARVAIDALLSTFTREPTTDGLLSAFSEANRSVWQESQDQSELHGMGTTLTAMALVGGADGRDMIALANVGDSRAYVFSEGRITQVTADHSLAEERMRQGEMTEEEAAVHPQRHILTRALGVSPDVEADMWELKLRAGDRIVLCSDGLSNELSLEELGQVLAAEPDPGDAARRLVEAANAHGGADNITVVVVDVLVGEEGGGAESVVKPIGRRAGPPLIVAPLAVPVEGTPAEGTPAQPAEAPPEEDSATEADSTPSATAATAATAATTAAAAATATTEASQAWDDTTTGVVPAVPRTAAETRTDTLAPGAQLGFGGDSSRLTSGDQGPQSGEHFLGNTQTAPIARSSVRADAPPAPAPIPRNESRGARRRRLGIPRRITVRVVLFAILLAAIPVGAFFAVRWYAYDNWYPSVHGSAIVIEQGRSGGVLWFNPKVVNNTGVSTSEVLPLALAHIHAGVQEPSLDAAKKYVANAHQAWLFQQSGKTPSAGNGSGIGPSGSLPTTTVPPAGGAPAGTPATAPGATTTTTLTVTP